MSGHSKWANIKHRKEKTDASKGKMFTKLGREIAVCVREGGADPNSNGKLKDIIAKAKSNNMPNDTIDRSIKKAAGLGDGMNYEELVYEGYGAAGVAIIVEAMTENRNRTGGEVKHLFDKYHGNMGATGCVSWMFDRKGQIIIEKSSKVDEDELMTIALEAGAEDFGVEDEYFEIITSPDDFSSVREKLEQSGLQFLSADIEMIPQNYTSVSDEDRAKVEKLIDYLEDNDDVQKVYTNME